MQTYACGKEETGELKLTSLKRVNTVRVHFLVETTFSVAVARESGVYQYHKVKVQCKRKRQRRIEKVIEGKSRQTIK